MGDRPDWVTQSHDGLHAEVPAVTLPFTALAGPVVLAPLFFAAAVATQGPWTGWALVLWFFAALGLLAFLATQGRHVWWSLQRMEVHLDGTALRVRRTLGSRILEDVHVPLTEVVDVTVERGEVAAYRLAFTFDRPPFDLLLPAAGAMPEDLQWWCDAILERAARADLPNRQTEAPDALRALQAPPPLDEPQ